MYVLVIRLLPVCALFLRACVSACGFVERTLIYADVCAPKMRVGVTAARLADGGRAGGGGGRVKNEWLYLWCAECSVADAYCAPSAVPLI